MEWVSWVDGEVLVGALFSLAGWSLSYPVCVCVYDGGGGGGGDDLRREGWKEGRKEIAFLLEVLHACVSRLRLV